MVFLRYKQALNGIADDELEYRLVAPLCPLIAAASVCIFAGFSYLNIKIDFGKMPVLTFYVYLFHAGVWTILSKAIRETGYGWNNLIIIPASVVIVFVFSIILSKMYLAIWTWLENKWKISDKFCKIIHLNKC